MTAEPLSELCKSGPGQFAWCPGHDGGAIGDDGKCPSKRAFDLGLAAAEAKSRAEIERLVKLHEERGKQGCHDYRAIGALRAEVATLRAEIERLKKELAAWRAMR